MDSLVEKWEGQDVPSRAFADGGIHEAIMDYEDTVFFEILAEELARRGYGLPARLPGELRRIGRPGWMTTSPEFEAHGTDNLVLSNSEE